jgi:hypothetical protein
MFGRCKRIIEATGTIINNYPRNIFSLLGKQHGEMNELNPYGIGTQSMKDINLHQDSKIQ